MATPLFLIAILSCSDGQASCRSVARAEAAYTTVAACEADRDRAMEFAARLIAAPGLTSACQPVDGAQAAFAKAAPVPTTARMVAGN